MAYSAFVSERANYQGRRQSLVPGRYDVYELAKVGNDTISAIGVEPGLRVTAYAEAGFWGDSRVFTSSTPNLSGTPLNNRISSIVVEQPAVIYEGPDFTGPSQMLTPGRYDIGQISIKNDSVTSLRVPPHWSVTLYAEAGFWGDSRRFTADTKNVGALMNNRTSSIVVEAPTTGLISGRVNPPGERANLFFVVLYGPNDRDLEHGTKDIGVSGMYAFQDLAPGRYWVFCDTRGDLPYGPKPNLRQVDVYVGATHCRGLQS